MSEDKAQKIVSLPSVDDAGAAAVGISDSVTPSLSAQEQAFFIAGFQECIKWLCLQSPAASPVSDAVELLNEAKRLLKIAYVNNEHDMGFDLDYQNWLDKIDSTTPTNVQEQDEGTREVWVDIAATFLSHISVTGSTDDAIVELKAKYTITKKQ